MEEGYKLVIICTRPAQLNTLKGFLERRKWTVSAHSSVKAGFDAIKQVKPDWVLVSISMPGLNPSKIAPLVSQLSSATMMLFTEGSDNKSVSALFSHSAFQIVPPPISGPKILIQVQKIMKAREERAEAATEREVASANPNVAAHESDSVMVRNSGSESRDRHDNDIIMMKGKRQGHHSHHSQQPDASDSTLEAELARELEDLEREAKTNAEAGINHNENVDTKSQPAVSDYSSDSSTEESGGEGGDSYSGTAGKNAGKTPVIMQESVAKHEQSGVIIQEGLKSKQKAGSIIEEGLKANDAPGAIIEEGLKSKQKAGAIVQKGVKTTDAPGAIVEEGLKSKQKSGAIVQQGPKSKQKERPIIENTSYDMDELTSNDLSSVASVSEPSTTASTGVDESSKPTIKTGTVVESVKGSDLLSKQMADVFQKVCPDTGEVAQKEIVWARRLGVIPVKSADHQGMLILALDDVGMAPASFLNDLVKFTRESLNMKTTEEDSELEFFVSVDAFDFPSWAKKQGEFFITTVFRSARVGATFVSDTGLFDRVFVEKKAERFAFPSANLFPAKSLDFDIYVYLPTNQKFVKYIHAGQRVSEEQIAGLAKKNVTEFFIESHEVYAYRQYYLGGLIREYISRAFEDGKSKGNAA